MIGKVLAAAALLAASSASARDLDGGRWYAAFDLGHHWPGDINTTSTGNAPDGKPYDWQWKFKNDWAINGRLGYRVGKHWRLEGEFGFQHTGVESVHAPGAEVNGMSASRPGEPYGLCASTPVSGGCAPASGLNKDITAVYTGMANLIYDLSPERKISPFIGAGVGITHIEMLTTYWFSNVPGPITPVNPAVQKLKIAGTLTRPGEIAIQGLAGVSYRVAPKLHLDLTYRYYATPGSLRWNPVNYTYPGLPLKSGLRPGDFLGRFDDQSMSVGVRYNF